MLFVLLFGVASVSANEDVDDSVGATDESAVIEASDSGNNTLVQSDSGDENVYSSPNSEDVLSAADGTFKELYDQVKNGGTITLDRNYVYTASSDSAYVNGITLDKAITINGNGYTLDGNNAARIFQITASNVVLNNIKFINGKSASGGGGALYWTGTSGTVNGCEFDSNFDGAKVRGGAVAWRGAQGTISYCNFNNNKVTLNGNDGGAIDITGSNTLVTNCNFINNTSKDIGSAISVTTTYVTIKNSYFEGNKIQATDTDLDGGAVSFESGHYGTVDNCTFVNNVASHGSGALDFRSGTNGTVTRCTFINNQGSHGAAVNSLGASNGLTISNCEFINNTATTSGGGVYITGSNSEVSDCDFYGNTANGQSNNIAATASAQSTLTETGTTYGPFYVSPNGNGDGSSISKPTSWENALSKASTIYLTEGIYENILDQTITRSMSIIGLGTVTIDAKNSNKVFTIKANDVTIENINFKNGKSSNGGLIYWTGNYGTINKCNFEKSIATTYGGAIYWSGTYATIKNSIFSNNEVSGGSSYQGGALKLVSSHGNIVNCEFYNNVAIKGDGDGGAIVIQAPYCIIKNSYFENNKCFDRGSAVAYMDSGNYGQIINCTFVKNNATGSTDNDGGALDVRGNHILVQDSRFYDNWAVNGGGLHIWTGSNNITVKNCEFVNNTAKSNGGAINYKGDSDITNVYIEDCSFINNSATTGGAIYSRGINTTIKNSEFIGNSATSNGGAVYTSATGTTINNCELKDNTAAGKLSDITATSAASSTLVETDVTFGPIYISPNGKGDGRSSSNPTNWTYAIEHIAEGSSIIFTKGTYSTFVNYDLKKSISLIGMSGAIINNNHAGRAFIISAKDVSINGLTFTQNGLSYVGGAIRWNGNYGTLTNCTFNENSYNGGDRGGALRWYGSYGLISDCEFKSNTATSGDGDAGAINIDGAYVTVDNCYFYGNKANDLGSAINVNGNYAVIKNSRFEKNEILSQVSSSQDNDGGTLSFQPGKHAIISNCTFKDNTAKCGAGAIAFHVGAQANTTIEDCKFINNKGSYGGAINSFVATAPGVTVSNCEFTNNSATISGGAIYYNSNSLNVTDCNFTGNKANNGGGAIYLTGENATITNSEFTNNSAPNGGSIQSTKEITISDCEIENQLTIEITGNDVGSTATLTGTFANGAPATVDVYVDGTKKGSSNVKDKTFTYQITGLGVGEHIISLKDSNGNTYEFDEKLIETASTIYVTTTEKSGATGLTASSPVLWSKAIKYINSGGKIIFAAGSYSDVINRPNFMIYWRCF